MEFQREPLPDHQLPGVVMGFLLQQGKQAFSFQDFQRALEEAGVLESARMADNMLSDLIRRGQLRYDAGRLWSQLPRAFGAGRGSGSGSGGDGGGGGGDGNTPDGDGDPARGLREVLTHPYLLSYAAEDFDAALGDALTRFER